MKQIQNAIIGGTGVYQCGVPSETIPVETEFGEVDVDIAEFRGKSIVFLARHGKNHTKPPHLINYRANLKALQNIGVKHIYSTFAVGSLNKNLPVGSLVILKDFLDMTRQRAQTFFEGAPEKVKHVNLNDPYCKNLREKLSEKAKQFMLNLNGDVVYVCTEGPRFETEAEIKMMSMFGADVVGMTSVPEVVLAKELGLCYASVGLIVNMATGMETGSFKTGKIEKIIDNNKEKVNRLFLEIFSESLNQKNCDCKDSILNL